MRGVLSIPLLVLILSGGVWLLSMGRQLDSELVRQWVVRVCEILFAAAAFALMFSLVRTTHG